MPAGSRRKVMNGTSSATIGGLKKSDLTKNKYGRIVSKEKQALGENTVWMRALDQAQKELGIKKRPVPLRKDMPLYKVAKDIKDRMMKATGRSSTASALAREMKGLSIKEKNISRAMDSLSKKVRSSKTKRRLRKSSKRSPTRRRR